MLARCLYGGWIEDLGLIAEHSDYLSAIPDPSRNQRVTKEFRLAQSTVRGGTPPPVNQVIYLHHFVLCRALLVILLVMYRRFFTFPLSYTSSNCFCLTNRGDPKPPIAEHPLGVVASMEDDNLIVSLHVH